MVLAGKDVSNDGPTVPTVTGMSEEEEEDDGVVVIAPRKPAPQCRPLTTGKPYSTHPWRECPSPTRPSGEWLPWAEGLQAVPSN